MLMDFMCDSKERVGSKTLLNLWTSEAGLMEQPSRVMRRSPPFRSSYLWAATMSSVFLLLNFSRLGVIQVFMAWRQWARDGERNWEDGKVLR